MDILDRAIQIWMHCWCETPVTPDRGQCLYNRNSNATTRDTRDRYGTRDLCVGVDVIIRGVNNNVISRPRNMQGGFVSDQSGVGYRKVGGGYRKGGYQGWGVS